MMYRILSVLLLSVGLMLTGCEEKTAPTKPNDTPKAKDKHDEDEHVHGEGPNGGTVFDFAKTHAEFCVDHKTKTVTLYLHSYNLKRKAPVAADKLTLSIKKPAFTVDLIAKPQEGDEKGKSSRFVATHDNFGVEQEFEGTVSAMIDGKPYSESFKEEAEVHEKDKKK